MFAQTLLFTGLLLGAPPEPPVGIHLEKGLETRWTGTFTEASFRPGVRAIRTYEVDVRLLVLNKDDQGHDVALFSRVFLKPELKSTQPPSGVVRLELARVDRRGRVVVMPSAADYDNPDPKARPWPLVKLQGLPFHEAGMFVPLPETETKWKVGATWNHEEPDRPTTTWKITDQDSFRSQSAWKVIGSQKTTHYYTDRIRQAEWRREDRLTVLPNLGVAARIERIVERREPDADEIAFRSVLNLEQQGRITYSGRLFEERRDEAINAAAFTAVLDRLLADGGRKGPQPFETLIKRIHNYEADHVGSDSVPYREALIAVRRRADSAARGNLPPAQAPEEKPASATEPLTIGTAIPDIVLKPLGTGTETTLHKLKGRTVVLAYFQPSAPSAAGVLKLAQSMHMQAKTDAVIVPLVIGESGPAKTLHAETKLTVPLFDGNAVYKTHGLDATPVFIIVDAQGIVRNITRGWGSETSDTVAKIYERWLKP